MNYYYLGSILPALSIEAPSPLTMEAFLALCGEHLASRHMNAIRRLIQDPLEENSVPFAQEWRERETRLRNALVRIRASRTGKEGASYLREEKGADGSAERAATEAYAKPNPREREWALDQFRWHQIEELAGFNPFSEEAIFAYGLKLRIVQRWGGVDEEMGQNIVKGIVHAQPERDVG